MKTTSLLKTTSPVISAIAQNILAVGTGLALLGAGSAQAAILIDSFNQPDDNDPGGTQFVEIVAPSGVSDFNERGSFSRILGGYRDVLIEKVDFTGAGDGAGATVEILNGLNWSNETNIQSKVTVTWDGQGFSGLPGVDLTATNTLDGILLGATNDIPGLKITLDVYSDATNFSRAMISPPLGANPSSGPAAPVFFSFTSCSVLVLSYCANFTPQAGGGANFSSVQAIQLILEGPADIDGTIRFIQADKEPKPVVPEPTPVISLLAFGTLGAGSMLKRKLRHKSDQQKTKV